VEQEKAWQDHSTAGVAFPLLPNASFRDIARHELESISGITDQMLRRSWCVGKKPEQTRLNVKIVNGKLVRSTLVPGDRPDRAQGSLEMIKDALKRDSLENVSLETTLYVSDLSPDVERGRKNPLPDFKNPHPILVYEKKTGDKNSIVFPEFDFYKQDWKTQRRKILNKSDQTAWSQRLPKLLFRGQSGGYRNYVLPAWSQLQAQENMDVKDTKFNTAVRIEHEDHAKYKYLLNMPGVWGGTANRLKYLMATGSPVLVPENDFYEFWYPMVEPYKHYVPVLNLYKYGGQDIPGIVQCLSEYDEEAQRIGENGKEFIRHVLDDDATEEYIEVLFQMYAAKMVDAVSSDEPQKVCP
jgi:protein glucosyltransferase